jgi:prepilin peptidase CpaA
MTLMFQQPNLVLLLFGGPILMLFCSVYTDLKRHRIPNVLTFSGLALGLLIQTTVFGLEGAVEAMFGMCIGLAVFTPFYLLGGMGAGDVKLMGALGAFLGPFPVFVAGLWSLIAGAVLAILLWLSRQHAFGLVSRYGLSAVAHLMLNARQELLHTGSNDPMRFPFALAIALGTGWTMWSMTSASNLVG